MKTSADEIAEHFGQPNRVELVFYGGWQDFKRLRKLSLASVPFNFEYSMPGRGLSDEGPLGEAGKTTVEFTEAQQVYRVTWHYPEGYRLHTRTGEDQTKILVKQIEALPGGPPIIKRFDGTDPNLTPQSGRYRFKGQGWVLDVDYINGVSDIYVYLTLEGDSKW
jgi:hypothetical protein